MKHTRVVIAAFCISTGLSLIIGAFLIYNIKVASKSVRMSDTGKQIQQLNLRMETNEKAYLLSHRDEIQEDVKDGIARLRKAMSLFEKDGFAPTGAKSPRFDVWEEVLNLYERLFDQFVLYHRAVEKNIADIRALEKSILAVIFSKMNPERGIIALQEVRIHEKGYLLYRNYPTPPDERSFEDKRKEAVNNLLMWAQKDKRIEELMEQDNKLFGEIMSNYESQDNTLSALRRERERMKDIGEGLSEEGNKRLAMVQRRLAFLTMVLMVMWGIVALAIIGTRFR